MANCHSKFAVAVFEAGKFSYISDSSIKQYRDGVGVPVASTIVMNRASS